MKDFKKSSIKWEHAFAKLFISTVSVAESISERELEVSTLNDQRASRLIAADTAAVTEARNFEESTLL